MRIRRWRVKLKQKKKKINYFNVEKIGIPVVTSDEIIDMIPVETKIPVEENLWIPEEEEELTKWILADKKQWNIDGISGLTKESKDWLSKTMKKK